MPDSATSADAGTVAEVKSSDLKRLMASELAGVISGVEFDVLEDPEGEVHAVSPGSMRWCARLQASTSGWHARSADATELVGSCPKCLTKSAGAHKGAVVEYAAALVAARASVAQMSVLSGTSGAVLMRRRKAAERVALRYGNVPAAMPKEVRAAAGDLVEAATGVLEVLRVAGTSDVVKDEVLAQIRRKVVPRRWEGTFELDSTPMLIGVCPLPAWSSNEIKALVDALALRARPDLAVLLAPAYVHTFLVGRLRSRPDDAVMVQSYPAPASEDLAEVAAALWDPFGEGSLVGLKEALAAAEALAV